MMRDVAHYFRDDGAAVVAFEWSARQDLFLAIAPVVAVPPAQPSVSPHLVYLRFHRMRNRAEADAFLRYLTTLSAPHNVMQLRSDGRRTDADGSTTEHMEIAVPNTDVTLMIICEMAEAAS